MDSFLPDPPDPNAADADDLTVDFSAGQQPARYSLAKIQVAPLIDTVLFLIWFYILVGQLVMHQKDSSVQLPMMASPLAAQEVPAEVIINLRQDGAITVEGALLTPDQLRGLLRDEIEKAQSHNESLRVVLRADRRQQVAAAGTILAVCQEAHLTQVIFRAEDLNR